MFSNTTLVLERRPGRLRLYLGGDLQFDTDDEVIYHERLAHPALLAARARLAGPLHLLVLGGGDGLLARELLRHEGVASVRVIDYNPEVLALAGTELVPWNESSLADHRVVGFEEPSPTEDGCRARGRGEGLPRSSTTRPPGVEE